jgi:hypothetical protein
MSTAQRQLAGFVGLALVVGLGGCGRTGISLHGSGADADIATDGNGGAIAGSGGTGGQVETTDSTSTGNPGGTTRFAGNSGQGGASSIGSTGGVKASAGMALSSAGNGGSGGVTSSAASGGKGGTSGQGGVSSFPTALAGNSGQGGVGSGGSKGSGGSSGGQSGTIVSPRVPAVHRAQANSCVGVFAPAEPVDPNSGSSCKKHADCTQGKNGRCITDPVGMGRAAKMYYCAYDSCATDADCDPGKVCYCTAGDAAHCFYAGNCRTDADCGGGATSYCSPAYGNDCGGYHWYSSYYCHTTRDTCIDDSDCTGKNFCDYNVVSGRWECTAPNMSCAIG